ncbi:MAG: hypothetical protein J1G38_04745 [Clostridiales bacterium]|nr:hypothetical protein [Clostridiales bacterium]
MSKVKFILLNIFIYVFCAFLCVLGVVHYFDDYGKADAIRSGVIVQAEWIGILPNMHKGGTPTTYDLGYEYVDENGVIYRGECSLRLRSYEEAKSYIGKKVDIYIDGKGHSILVSEAEDFNQNTAWILMGLAIGIFVCYTVALTIWGILQRRKKRSLDEDMSTQLSTEQSDIK